ncbi:hypothetical protein H9636_07255 [Ureibacillus sp. Re31]|uniref:Uncharacterized protein n=1 Tax=Ureibacillus galli TaxID=2762222 RepID=A0ABR8XAW5_9BACL|nr:hypothetical protein [Ureibacillus galli]MBD8026455.1 hypothetical protein [Ureibacillus galli]
MNLTKINNEVFKEKACIDDLLVLIKMHTQEGRFEIAERLTQDLQNSIATIQKLEQRREFYITAKKLAKQGILTEVVKRVEIENLAR